MSLLTNPFFAIGSGLLARSGPSLTPVNPYMGVNDGLMAVQAARQDEVRTRGLALQEQKLQADLARQQMMDQYAATLTDPTARAFPEIAAQQELQSRYRPREPQKTVKVMTAGEAGYGALPPDVPVEVQYVDGVPFDVAPVSLPAAPADPRGQIGTRYDEAVRKGYTGTLMDYEIMMKNAGASKISIGEGRKPMSISDLSKLRMPDGSPPPVGMTPEEALAAGATLVTPAQEGKEKLGAETSGYKDTLRENAAALKEANDRYKKEPSPQNYARLQAAQGGYATALGQVRNPKGEPSGDVIRQAAASVPLPFSGSGMLTGMTGGDSIEAGLREADALYGLGLFKDEATDTTETPAALGDLYKKYPGLR